MATAQKKKAKKSIGIQPLGERIVVERDSSETTTTGGIVLPDSAKDKPSRGVVLSVGEGRLLEDGSRAPLQVNVGDHVIFTSYGPEELKVGEETYLLLREDDVLAVIE